jgi:deoxyribodipyrimidine photo-lyase
MITPIELTHETIEAFIDERSPALRSHARYTHFRASTYDAHARLSALDPDAYDRTRNYLKGQVTRLSVYISCGFVSLQDVFFQALNVTPFDENSPLMKELMWRAYFRSLLRTRPELKSVSFGPYKTGWPPESYRRELPEDVQHAQTPNAAINHFIQSLYDEGYVHNHARLYLAAYLVHFRRLDWRVGARWMHGHLIDADDASNHLSWQWVASTLSNKPYLFNLENLQKYAHGVCDTSAEANPELVGTYEALSARLMKESNNE